MVHWSAFRHFPLLFDCHKFADTMRRIVKLFVNDCVLATLPESFQSYSDVLLPADVFLSFRRLIANVALLTFASWLKKKKKKSHRLKKSFMHVMRQLTSTARCWLIGRSWQCSQLLLVCCKCCSKLWAGLSAVWLGKLIPSLRIHPHQDLEREIVGQA